MVVDKWLELLSNFSDFELFKFPCEDLVPVELPMLSSSVGSAARGGGLD